MLKWAQFSETLGAKRGGSWKDSARLVSCAMAHVAEWRETETSGCPAQWRGCREGQEDSPLQREAVDLSRCPLYPTSLNQACAPTSHFAKLTVAHHHFIPASYDGYETCCHFSDEKHRQSRIGSRG